MAESKTSNWLQITAGVLGVAAAAIGLTAAIIAFAGDSRPSSSPPETMSPVRTEPTATAPAPYVEETRLVTFNRPNTGHDLYDVTLQDCFQSPDGVRCGFLLTPRMQFTWRSTENLTAAVLQNGESARPVKLWIQGGDREYTLTLSELEAGAMPPVQVFPNQQAVAVVSFPTVRRIEDIRTLYFAVGGRETGVRFDLGQR